MTAVEFQAGVNAILDNTEPRGVNGSEGITKAIFKIIAAEFASALNSIELQIGTKIRTGTGAPSDELGIDADYYIDTVTYNMYGKAAGAYTIALNIRGAAGAVWRTGTAFPFDGIGVDGDYYLRSTDGNIFEKVAGSYDMLFSMKGPSAYDVAVSAGFVGTEAEWIAALQSNVIVNNYTELLALSPLAYMQRVLVLADEVNNGGQPSEYNLHSNGYLMWQASIKI